MEQIVKGCVNCPLSIDAHPDQVGVYVYWCDHPVSPKSSDIVMGEKGLITPEWCPLFQESLTISIKQ